MRGVRGKYVPPALDQVAFNCPHCGALAKQFWFSVHAEPLKKDHTPLRLDNERVQELTFDYIEDAEERERSKKWAEQMATGRPFIKASRQSIDYNLHKIPLSRCFSCNEVAIWIYDRLVWQPRRGTSTQSRFAGRRA